MGVETIIVCDGCSEYANLDKVPFPQYWENIDTAAWFDHKNCRYQTMKLIAFMTAHMCHDVMMIHSASEYQHRFFKTTTSDEFTEFELRRSINTTDNK